MAVREVWLSPPLFVVDTPVIAHALVMYLQQHRIDARPLLPIPPDCVNLPSPAFLLVEVHLPGPQCGLLWAKEVRAHYPKITPILWTQRPNGLHLWAAQRWGLPAFLDKNMAEPQLLQWLKHILQERGGWPGELVDQASTWGNEVAPVLEQLSGDMWLLWEGILQGHTNEHIARRKGWSKRTVERKVSELYGLLGVGSRVEAVRLAWEWGLVVKQGTEIRLAALIREMFYRRDQT